MCRLRYLQFVLMEEESDEGGKCEPEGDDGGELGLRTLHLSSTNFWGLATSP